ncbi:MAG: 50S ribosomal protein L13 [Nitrososphaerales archaeon]
MAKSETEMVTQTKTYYVDAGGKIAGRMCSHVSKLLLQGNRVIIVNAEHSLFSGSRRNIMSEWAARLNLGSVVHPKHGPFHPRTPDGILSRMVRGMLPRRKPSGAAALKRLRVYVGIPEEYSKVKFTDFEDSKATKPIAFYFPLGEIATKVGWKGGEV